MRDPNARRAAAWLAAAVFLVLAALLAAPRAATAQASETPRSSWTPSPTYTPRPSRTPTASATVNVPTPRPTLAGTPTATLFPGPNTYTVQPGDQLLAIARRFGLTLDTLRAANHLREENFIVPGQVLFIPTPVPARVQPTIPPGLPTYTVQPGDQLLAIARRFGVTAEALQAANGLRGDTLTPGQVLVIPPPGVIATPIGGVYIVQPGDQLLAIARRYGLTLSHLKAVNALTSDTIRPGQRLTIPLPQAPTATRTPAPGATGTALPAGSVTYVVQPGDRLIRIAVWYGVTVDAIRTANRLASDTLSVGQTLVIPSPLLRPTPYTVQPGDTLIGLAARFGTTVEALKIANRMTGDTIYRGLVLIIPMR